MGGKLTLQRYLVNDSVSADALNDEICLLGNAETLFQSVMDSEDTNITELYIATKSGILLSYSDVDLLDTAVEQGESYFDFYDSNWYKTARNGGKLFFTGIYSDAYGRGSMITCACPVYRDGVFSAVVCLDMKQDDLQSDIFSMSLPEGSYAFLVDSNTFAASIIPGRACAGCAHRMATPVY